MARRTNTNRTSNRGGQRTPSNPTTFSSFGSASSRTDGSLSGEFRAEDRHGQNQQLNSAAQGLNSGGRPGPSPSPVQGNADPLAAILGPNTDPFRPSERPNEPSTAGAPIGAGPGPTSYLPGDDVDMKLQAIYDLTGDPIIAGLIRSNNPSRQQ